MKIFAFSCLLLLCKLVSTLADAVDQALLVESHLDFGFFSDVEPKEPTLEEVKALVTRASEWYDDKMRQALPKLTRFYLEYVDHVYCPEEENRVQVDFDAYAVFPAEGAASKFGHNGD